MSCFCLFFFAPACDRRELSTDQVDKPVNTGALTKWVGHIPTDVREEMRKLAPMLDTLGYDPDAYPPNYGTPDKSVAVASELVQENQRKLRPPPPAGRNANLRREAPGTNWKS